MTAPALLIGDIGHKRMVSVRPDQTMIRVPRPVPVAYWGANENSDLPLPEIKYYRRDVHVFGRMVRVFVAEGHEGFEGALLVDALLNDDAKAVIQ